MCAQVAYLPFEGKNKVLFRTKQSIAKQAFMADDPSITKQAFMTDTPSTAEGTPPPPLTTITQGSEAAESSDVAAATALMREKPPGHATHGRRSMDHLTQADPKGLRSSAMGIGCYPVISSDCGIAASTAEAVDRRERSTNGETQLPAEVCHCMNPK